MKQSLRFQSEQEFQSFFGQLSSSELPDFQAVEGAGGDGGFDGISGTVAFQVYFPEEKNRTDSNYISKINEDVGKVLKTKVKLGLTITDWVLVVPEDLRITVVAHLQKKSSEAGLKCKYWGATKLLELITKYPYIQDSFPTIFLPPVRDGIKDIQNALASGDKPRVLTSVDIVTDDEYERQKNVIREEYKTKIHNFVVQHGTHSSAHLAADTILKQEADKKTKELQLKKEKSDKAYSLDLDEINEYFDEQIKSTNEDFNRRGLFNSGMRESAIGKLEVQRQRSLERLKLKFGKK